MVLTINTTLKEGGNIPSKSIIYSNTQKHVVEFKTKNWRGNLILIISSILLRFWRSMVSCLRLKNLFTHRSSSNHHTQTAAMSVYRWQLVALGMLALTPLILEMCFEYNSRLWYWIFYRILVKLAVFTHRFQKPIHALYTTATRETLSSNTSSM